MTKAKIFDTMVFADTNAAQAILAGFDEKIKRIKIGLILCGASFLSLLLSAIPVVFISNFFFYTSIIATIAAYVISGGIKIALRTALKLAKIGWLILPFPLDIFTGLVTFIVSLFFFAFFPIVFVLISLLQTIRDKREAEAYLTYGASMYQQSQYAEAQNVTPQYVAPQNVAPQYRAPQGNPSRPTPPPFI
jgi:hypothetical protein